MMLVLKLPILYLVGVVWYAVRAEPRPPEGAALLAELPEDVPGGGRWNGRRGRRFGGLRGPHGGPVRSYPRAGLAARARAGR